MEQKGWRDGGVIKPLVSASGMHTYRFSLKDDVGADSPLSLASVLATCLTTGVSQWLLQPFQSEFMSEGEWSFVFVEGEHSHTVLSVPAAAEANESAPPAWQDDEAPARSAEEAAAQRMARAKEPTGFMVQACHGGSFRYIDASRELVDQAKAILHATPYGRDSLYARVDCIRRAGGNGSGSPGTLLVSELELIEPELFGRGVPGFQDKLIDAIDRRIAPVGAVANRDFFASTDRVGADYFTRPSNYYAAAQARGVDQAAAAITTAAAATERQL
jgi:hypothetical protein